MCTEFLIQSENADYVCGRSMEYAIPLLSELIFFAPGHQFDQKLGDPSCKYTWEGKYGVVGMNCLKLELTTDGLNTAGLTTGCLWMPGTQYQENTDPDIAISSDHFCDWMLSTCATTGEVRDALEQGKIRVCGVGKMSALLALHFMVSDANGDAIVIEFIDGVAKIYDNPVGVMTNAPQFPWQVTNLENYVALSAFDSGYGPPGIKFGDLSVYTEGHGNGLQAIPGDSTPPSRFVRAATMASFSEPVKTADDAVSLAFHVLNTVDIPLGTSKYQQTERIIAKDHTQWIVVKDLGGLRYYVRMYDSPLVYSVDLNNVDFSAMDGKKVPVPKGELGIAVQLN